MCFEFVWLCVCVVRFERAHTRSHKKYNTHSHARARTHTHTQAIFTIDLIVNMWSHWFWPFIKETWNWLDLVVVLVSLASVATSDAGPTVKVIRILRAFRVVHTDKHTHTHSLTHTHKRYLSLSLSRSLALV